MLGWTVWGVGFSLLLTSTSLDSASVGVTILALFADSISYSLTWWFTHRNAVGRVFRRPMSRASFEAQGNRATEAALDQLRTYLKLHPELYASVPSDAELKLRR